MDQPIAGIHFLSALDTQNNFFPWWCNYNIETDDGISLLEFGQPTGVNDIGLEEQFLISRTNGNPTSF